MARLTRTVPYPPTLRAGRTIETLQKSVERANEILEIITAQRGSGKDSLVRQIDSLNSRIDNVYQNLQDQIETIQDTFLTVTSIQAGVNNENMDVGFTVPETPSLTVATIVIRSNDGQIEGNTGAGLEEDFREYLLYLDDFDVGDHVDTWRVHNIVTEVNISTPQVKTRPGPATYQRTWADLSPGSHTFRFRNPYAFNLTVRFTVQVLKIFT